MADLFRGRLSWRRLGVLVRQLPPEAALWRSIDPEAAAWGLSEQLLASAVDVLAVIAWMYQSVNRPKNSRAMPMPRQIPRPGVEPPAEHTERFGDTAGRDPDEARAYLDRFAPKHEAPDDVGGGP